MCPAAQEAKGGGGEEREGKRADMVCVESRSGQLATNRVAHTLMIHTRRDFSSLCQVLVSVASPPPPPYHCTHVLVHISTASFWRSFPLCLPCRANARSSTKVRCVCMLTYLTCTLYVRDVFVKQYVCCMCLLCMCACARAHVRERQSCFFAQSCAEQVYTQK